MNTGRLRGMPAFTLVAVGQWVSLLGTTMTQFGLTLWAYELTGSATALGLTAFFAFAPGVLLSPVAGALVDRWNRKLVMMISDVAAGVTTVIIFLLYNADALMIEHVYAAGAVAGAFAAFQFPAQSAAISLMIPKEQYGRAAGMLGLAEAAAGVFGAPFAAALLPTIGLRGILLIDIVTFVFAVGVLFFIHIPQPARTEAGREGGGGLLRESIYGFQYILARPSLLGLQLMFFCINLTGSFAGTLLTPMVLARTGNDEAAVATVQALGAAGGIIGSLLLTAWGGPKRRVYGVALGMVGTSLVQIGAGLGQTVAVWGVMWLATGLIIPILNGSNQAIWQAKVAPDVQGRVFATRRLIAQITAPVGMILSGVLADTVFEPAMRSGGALTPFFGALVGVGPGAGMGLIFVLTGAVGVLVGVIGLSLPVIREAEARLPDHASLTTDAPGAIDDLAEGAQPA